MFLTKIDDLFGMVEKEKKVKIHAASKQLGVPTSSISKVARYLEQLGFVEVDYKNVTGGQINYIKSPEQEFGKLDEDELINKLKFYKSLKDVKSANKLIYDLFNYSKRVDDSNAKSVYTTVRNYYMDNFMDKVSKKVKDPIKKLDSYSIHVDKLSVEVDIIRQELEPVPYYILFLFRISDVTRLVIDRIKEEVINKISFNVVFKTREEEKLIKAQYKKELLSIMKEVFVDLPKDKIQIFSDYIILTSLGMGDVEFMLNDKNLEEVVINNAAEPVRVYHKKYGWLETNIILDDESKVVHYATLAGRNVDKTITTLNPLMDGHLESGDRFNATINPISTKGNTLTIRKFAESPWSITDFIKSKTMDVYTAALIWQAIQYELSILIVGGTGSGKTSMLNVISIFIPPNQRVISIEDTREIRLPRTLHWVPLETRLANPEGKGEVTMLDLIVNSLRMRPDRVIVGEIRRKKEAEVLFEAMHTGHSVYATLHANTVSEAIIRLTTDPIGISTSLLSSVNLLVVQNRNRRTGRRRTFQVAELLENGDYNMLFKYDFQDDELQEIEKPERFYETMELFSGMKKSEVNKEISEKVKILNHLIKNNITDNEEIALIISHYYVNKDYLLKKLFSKK